MASGVSVVGNDRPGLLDHPRWRHCDLGRGHRSAPAPRRPRRCQRPLITHGPAPIPWEAPHVAFTVQARGLLSDTEILTQILCSVLKLQNIDTNTDWCQSVGVVSAVDSMMICHLRTVPRAFQHHVGVLWTMDASGRWTVKQQILLLQWCPAATQGNFKSSVVAVPCTVRNCSSFFLPFRTRQST